MQSHQKWINALTHICIRSGGGAKPPTNGTQRLAAACSGSRPGSPARGSAARGRGSGRWAPAPCGATPAGPTLASGAPTAGSGAARGRPAAGPSPGWGPGRAGPGAGGEGRRRRGPSQGMGTWHAVLVGGVDGFESCWVSVGCWARGHPNAEGWEYWFPLKFWSLPL